MKIVRGDLVFIQTLAFSTDLEKIRISKLVTREFKVDKGKTFGTVTDYISPLIISIKFGT